MSDNFSTVLEKRNVLLHRLAIWDEIVRNLQNYVPTDSKPVLVGIKSMGTSDGEMVVPFSLIEAEIQKILSGPLAAIQTELQTIDGSAVHVQESKGQKGKKKDQNQGSGESQNKGGAAKV